MWKIVLGSMLLATNAFAAVTLTVSPDVAVLDANRQFTLNFGLANDGSALMGFSLVGAPSQPHTVTIVSRTLYPPFAPGPPIIPPPLPPGSYLEDVDLGAVVSVGTAVVPSSGPLMDLVLRAEPTAVLPMTITFAGGWSNSDFNYTPFDTLVVTLTPEPTGMLLLAAGVAFLARRRECIRM